MHPKLLRLAGSLLFLVGFAPAVTAAPVTDSAAVWLRYPALSPDGTTIVFVHRGDLYRVAATGGAARQLTVHEAHDYAPVWSPDGRTIAFASERYGNFDVYTMPAAGGPASRLTYHSNDEMPYTFTPDGAAVVFGALRQDAASHRQFPSRSQPELYRVPVGGGRVGQVLTTPAEAVAYSPDGSLLYYHDKKGGEDEFRKHHVSAIARDLWSFAPATGQHRQLTTHPAEDRHPVPSADGRTLYFLSERSGTFNVWRMPAAGGGPATQLTFFSDHPVRSLSRDGGDLLCFSQDGGLYTLRPGEEPTRVPITILSQAGHNPDKFVSVDGGVTEMAISPNGKEIAFVARGEVFVTSVDASFTKRITNTPEQERFVTWGPEGKTVVYARESGGNWSTYASKRVRATEEPYFYAATLLEENPVLDNGRDNYLVQYSPDGKKIAWVEDRRTIRVRSLDGSDTLTLLDQDELFHMRDGDKYFTWSPDSEWLLVEWDVLLNNSEILLLKADGSKRVNLTESGYYDYHPKWADGGKRMLWFSNRDGLKSYATSGRSEADVYAMFFTQAAWDEYNLSEEDAKLAKAITEAAKKEKEKQTDGKADKKDKTEKKDSTQVKPLTFDWDQLDERTARLTIHSSNLGDAVLSKDGGKLYYLATFEKEANLWSTDLRTRETKQEIEIGAEGELAWDRDHQNLYLLSKGNISKLDLEKSLRKPVKLKGELEFDAAAERRAIFDHVGIRTRAIFYEPSFHGVDWDSLRGEYARYLPGVGNSFELTELLSEMLGELNVSHAGARYRPRGFDNPDETASLGIFVDYDYTGDDIRIAEVIAGGPLDRAAFAVEAGDLITAIDGQAITPDRDLARYLNRRADEFTLLEVTDSTGANRRSITVKPISLSDENELLYKRWVRANAAEVDAKSGGKLGYVHIPGMSDGPYRDIYEDMLGKYRGREAIIVDTRFNGGGDLVADLAMFFTGVPFITYATEARVVGGEPTSRWTKPTLALINEAQYSDGHCFAQGYTDLKIGKTVGMPTPGTCSFAGWERLPDGSVWGVVPVSARNIDGKWMENLQTEPDIRVKNEPAVIAAGRDQQLERAIEELSRE